MTSVSVSRREGAAGENSSIRRLGRAPFFVLTKHWRVRNHPKRVDSRIIFLPWSKGRISDRLGVELLIVRYSDRKRD